MNRKAKLVMYVLQYAKIDNKQLFIEINLAFFVYRIQIVYFLSGSTQHILLNNGRRPCYSSSPIDFIKTRMQVLQNKHYKTFVILIPFLYSQEDIQKVFALRFFMCPNIGACLHKTILG